MVQLNGIEESTESRRRGRGPNKPYPPLAFQDALELSKRILELGFTSEIPRLTLMNDMGVSPGGNKARDLISSSYKYGLTDGNYNSKTLTLTEVGRRMANSALSTSEDRMLGFSLAIERVESFRALHEMMLDSRLRTRTVIHFELTKLGVDETHCDEAAEVLEANLRFLGLVQDVSGADYVVGVEESTPDKAVAIEVLPTPQVASEPSPAPPQTSATASAPRLDVSSDPTVHIDVQIHIDSSASSEQIDQIFSSMARHLYGRES